MRTNKPFSRSRRLLSATGIALAYGFSTSAVQAQTATAAGGTTAPQPKTSDKTASWIVLFDLTKGERVTENRVFSFPGTSLLSCEDNGNGKRLKVIKQDPEAMDQNALKALVTKLKSDSGCFGDLTQIRWKGTKGQILKVIALTDSLEDVKVAYKETARKSRLEADLITAAKLYSAMSKAPTAAGQPDPSRISLYTSYYTLKETRALLDVSIAKSKGEKADATDPKVTLTTGPAERWFLTANIRVNNASQIKFDDKTQSLATNEKPSEFYVGANWSFGDLLSEPAADWRVRFIHGAYVGAFMEGSKRPAQQVGAVLGFRYIPILETVIAVDKISPYVGVLFIRNDTIASASGTAPPKVSVTYAKPRFLFGLTLNLSEALGWVGGSSSGGGKEEKQ